jgi:hypothetical protein
MSTTRLLSLAVLACAAGASAQERPTPIVCTPKPVACAPRPLDRLDPQLQRLLVERQLEKQPPYWTTVYFYLPALNERELQELQIRYLEELLAREKEKAKRLAAEE